MNLENKRLLIIKPSSLGDIVHTLPVVHALKRCCPDCSIGWIVQQAFAPLLEKDPAVEAVYPVHIPSTSDPTAGKFSYLHAFVATIATLNVLRRQLKQVPYDLILDLHASFRSGLLGRTNPGGLRIGFNDARELNAFFQRQLVEVPIHVEHAVAKNLLFCDYLGCEVDAKDFYMCCDDEDAVTVNSFLQQQGIADQDVIVYANPCARWQTKFWSIESWAALADRLHAEGVSVIFAGSGQDRQFIDRISKQMHSQAIVAAGKLGLTEAVALLHRSAAYVGLDSGPMHMAAMTGTPVAALFGPTHPERVGPYGVEHVILRHEALACLGCRKRHCDHGSCMKGISVEQVMKGLLSLLGHKKNPGSHNFEPRT